jgi:hypothetical protein
MNSKSHKMIDFKKVLVLALDALSLVIFIFARKITEIMMRSLSPCGIFSSFGIKCLTCGGTRCVNALSRGEVMEAFGYNSFVPLALIALFFILLLMNMAWLRRALWAETLLKKLCNLKLVTILSIIVALYAFGRNVIPIIIEISQ